MYQRINDLREERNLSKKELAEILGLSQTNYSSSLSTLNQEPAGNSDRLSDLCVFIGDGLLFQR